MSESWEGKAMNSIRVLSRIGAASAAIVTAMTAGSSWAQETEAEAESEGVDEIIVTAEFRETNLQETPLAITAFSAENLEARGVTSSVELSSFVPNAVIQPLGAGWGATAAAFIRGVGLGDNILSFEPGVPIYVDDVYNGRPQGSIFDLLDLERVEVLRGPQGTLFGKNAIGGTVRLISRKPEGDGSGYVEATIGSYSRINLRGSFDFAIVPDKVMARISASTKNADGYFRILNYECVNGAGSLGPVPPGGVDLGADAGQTSNSDCVVDRLGDEGITSVRGALRFILGERAEFNLIGDFTRQRQKGPADKYTIINDTGLVALWNDLFAEDTFGVRYDDRFITDSPYTNYSTYTDPVYGRTDFPNINNLDHWGVSGTLDYELTDSIALKSITAYRKWWNEFGRDSDGSPLPADHTYDYSRHKQWTQEVRLTGTAGALDWTVGGFYYWAKDSNQGHSFLFAPIIVNQDSLDTQTTKNWAILAHGAYHITDQLTLTAGLRYTKDKKDAHILRINFPSGTTAVDTPILVETDQWSPLIELDYQVNDDLMLYALYSTGFRGGGFSPRPSNNLQVTAFGPDKLRNWEVGFKSDLFDNRVRFNANAFYMKHTDQQNYKNDEAPPGVPWFHAVNAGTSRNWGFEAELQAEPVAGLRIDGSLGYLNYKLLDEEGSGLCEEFSDGSPCYPTRAPKWNMALGAEYGFGLGGMGTLTPRLDVNYRSKIFFATYNGVPDANRPDGFQEGHAIVNARLTWDSPDEDWQVALAVQNLTDKVYFYGKLSLVDLLSREQGNIAPPRTWSVSVRRNF
jgi:iron complex outermembrane receptor protein